MKLKGGVLTPATAFHGTKLADRLIDQGIVMNVVKSGPL